MDVLKINDDDDDDDEIDGIDQLATFQNCYKIFNQLFNDWSIKIFK